MTKLYLAGPMRGIAEFNFPAFDAAAGDLRAVGHEVFNPADNDRDSGFDGKGWTGDENLVERGFDMRKALGEDTAWIAANADGLAILPGWEVSSGARAEVALAHALGLPVAPVASWLDAAIAGQDAPPANELIQSPTLPSTNAPMAGEVRMTSSTGGQKGSKQERFDLIPVGALTDLARMYGRGAEKYDDDNWRRGYDWKLSYAAAQRHLNQFWGGEDNDEEMGLPHVISAAWHCFALATFMQDHREFDSRYSTVAEARDLDALFTSLTQ